jgi:hypothetical protein
MQLCFAFWFLFTTMALPGVPVLLSNLACYATVATLAMTDVFETRPETKVLSLYS